jgi:hypothetical protein
MPRTHVLDRALQTSGKGPLMATVVIAAIGLLLLIWFVSPTERKRRSAMGELEIGADSARVHRLLGAPVRCSAAQVARMRAGFPTDWPAPAVESVSARLAGATAQRWVYPINLRKRIGCGAADGHTEVGIGKNGRVLWFIPVTGRTPIQMPDEYMPSADAS